MSTETPQGTTVAGRGGSLNGGPCMWPADVGEKKREESEAVSPQCADRRGIDGPMNV